MSEWLKSYILGGEEIEDEAKKMWPDLVIDLETLATCPSARVTEIGAVFIDPATRAIGPRMEMEINPFDGDQDSRDICPDTLLWWAQRNKDGHGFPGLKGGSSLGEMVQSFLAFYTAHAADGCRVWSQGTDFDLAILRDVLWDYGHPEPWQFRQARCLRTLAKELGLKHEGKATHRALADAEAEAEMIFKVCARLETLTPTAQP
jgi:hypothetical protein